MEDLFMPKGKISDKQFNFLTDYLSTRYGLRIPKEKKVLLESRLMGRLNRLKITDFEHYLEYIFNPKVPNNEYQYFINQITTHKTFFFRENYQFDFLSNVLSEYLRLRTPGTPINVWSAGCSTGEEVYTLGMLLQEKKSSLSFDYKIVGTDIAIPSLKTAARGIFGNELENLPADLRSKYFTPTGDGKIEFNATEIKSRIQLGVLNLNNKVYNLPLTFDFIFCRNVMIYFDAKTRGEVLKRMVDKIRPGGYLFLGHSETALGTELPLKSIRPTIYKKI
jgi:chemotaxis protein methyltransferase CheR